MQELELVKQLNDEELVLHLDRSVQEDRRTTVRLLAHMGEVDARRLYRDQGFPSMFDYAVQKLHMSEAEAAMRIRVARLGREFPVALEMLGRGELHLTALNLLAPVLSQENIGLLQRARFQSKQKVLELRAQYAPQPDAPSSIRRLPERKHAGAPAAASAPSGSAESASNTTRTSAEDQGSSRPPASSTAVSSGSIQVESGCVASIASKPTASDVLTSFAANDTAHALLNPRSASTFKLSMPSPSSAVVPLSPGRFKVTFTASQRVNDKLEEAEDLLRHQLPSRDLEQLFERALDALIAEHKKRRFAQTDKPRKTRDKSPKRSNADSRYPSAQVRRRVWARDGGRCCFKGPEGTRCSARSRLQFHHVMPYELGGPTTVDNITLMCSSHNALLAEQDYGREHIRSRIAAARRARAESRTQRTQARPPLRAAE